MHCFRHFLLCSFLSILAIACSTSTDSSVKLNLEGKFENASLNEREVFELKFEGTQIYAGTNDNLYRKSLSKSEWQPLGLKDGEVRAFVVFSEQEFLAAVNYGNGDSLTIAKTTKEGNNWYPFRNGFGDGKRVIPTEMEQSVIEPTTIYAGGGGSYIAITMDKGTAWNLQWNTWGTLGGLFLIKETKHVIWAGGMNGIFEPLLVKSTDGGETWEDITILENVETTVYDVAIHPSEQDQVLAGLGGGIRKSSDGGQSWHTVLEGVNIYTLVQSPRDGRIVYAIGQTPEGTLAYWASGDFGDTWEKVEMENSPAGVQVNDMVSVMVEGQEMLYFGTNKGVYSYTFEE